MALADEVNVISREEGSGTRGAFIELFGIEQKNEDGEKTDYTTDDCDITNSTSVMMTSVAGNDCAIGYISLGSMNETVKALLIDALDMGDDTGRRHRSAVVPRRAGSFLRLSPFCCAGRGNDIQGPPAELR